MKEEDEAMIRIPACRRDHFPTTIMRVDTNERTIIKFLTAKNGHRSVITTKLYGNSHSALYVATYEND
jgi:hypothetical protein